ncbi:hypothetical protein X801_04904 [Opisthorchis viverrini]|uniref:NADPH-dependent FMN reductase-like domain-containing protein n=1 Tax=Opisthorchis viverrini TaxID=6198 RepID=A0A1S8WYD0_OPIVI|nr:hypothetical protein X801_04904 [Opisthorchis viverrini]
MTSKTTWTTYDGVNTPPSVGGDPLNIHLPLLQIPWGFYSDPENQAPKELADLVHLVSQVDRIIVTTCEYNSAIPPALSNLLDHLPHSALAYKPAGIIAYTTDSTYHIE